MRVRPAVLVGFLAIAPTGAMGQEHDTTTLAQAARLALEWHPRSVAAERTWSAATARARQEAAARLPSLSAQGSVFRFQEPMVVFPLHALDPSQLEFNRTLVQGALNIGYTLFDGGTRGAAIGGARAEADGAGARLASVEDHLIVAVSQVYLAVLAARGELRAVERRLDALEAESARVSLLESTGATAVVEVLRAEAAIAQARADRSALRSQIRTGVMQLARLTNQPADRFAEGRMAAPSSPPLGPAERTIVLDEVTAGNPELVEARHRVVAAEWQYRSARGTWFPRLELVGGYTLYGSAGGGFTGEWQGGLRVSYPLFLGGRRPRAIAAASASAEAAQAGAEAAALEVHQAADRILASLEESADRIEALDAAVGHLAEVARIERLALEQGAGTQSEYLRAEANLSAARSRLTRARHGELLLYIELAALTGALNVAWLQTLEGINP